MPRTSCARLCDRVAVIDGGGLISVAAPGEAIRAFRDRLIETGDAATPLPAVEDTGGIPVVGSPTGPIPVVTERRVAITGCRLELPGAPERSHVLPGEGLTIALDLQVRQPVPNVAFGCAVFHQNGSLLFDCDSTMIGERHDLEPGPSTVMFEFSELPLLDGRYTVNVRVQEAGAGTVYARQEPAGTFEMVNPGRATGLVTLPFRVNVKPQQLG